MLTIDRSLQYATEGILADQVRAAGARAGWAAVMDPRTGEVLAMANVEADPRTHAVGNTGNNLAVTQNFEPGSVNKVITMSAGLDEGAGWLVRFGHPAFAALKVAGFLLLQGSLALLVGLSVWAVFRGSGQNYAGAEDDGEDDD